MRGKKKNRKILFQLAVIILLLFMLLTAAIVWTVSQSIIDGYLEAEKKHMQEMMKEPYSHFPFLEEGVTPEIQEWFLSQPEKEIIDYSNDLNEEEYIRFSEYGDETAEDYKFEWYANMPEDIRQLYLRWYFYYMKVAIRNEFRNANVDSIFIMDLKEGFQGLVFFDYRVTGESRKTGEYFDFDLSEHPVIRELIESGSEEMVFERSADFPDEGNYYIGYKPILINGKVRAVIGITYRWDDFRDTLTGTVRNSLIVIFSGMAVVLLVLLFSRLLRLPEGRSPFRSEKHDSFRVPKQKINLLVLPNKFFKPFHFSYSPFSVRSAGHGQKLPGYDKIHSSEGAARPKSRVLVLLKPIVCLLRSPACEENPRVFPVPAGPLETDLAAGEK